MQQIIDSEQINIIHLHIHSSHLYTFDNTFFIQAFTLYRRNITFNVVQHKHPINQFSELPFAVINHTHLIPRPRLLALVEAIGLDQKKSLLLRPIFMACEELSKVGLLMREDSNNNNPYWLLLSPFHKYEMNQWLQAQKNHLYDSTRYLKHETDQLNQEYFLLKLTELSRYICDPDKDHPDSPDARMVRQNFYTIICVYAMMKSVRQNNQILYQIMMKDQAFQRKQEEGIKITTGANQPQFLNDDPQFYYSIKNKGNQQQKQEKKPDNVDGQPPNWKNDLLGRLIPSIIVLGTFWKVCHSFAAQ